MTKGYLAFVLHAHLPFVRHPEYPDFLEEDWLYEAITETYVPLLQAFESLRNDGVNFQLTMTLSPPICEMLADPLLTERYRGYLDNLISLSEKEIARTEKVDRQFNPVVRMYLRRLLSVRSYFVDRHGSRLLNAFRSFLDSGHLDIITCTATHGFLPLIKTDNAIRAQIQVAAANYRKHFQRDPKGIWLAECGYRRDIEDHLSAAGIKYFVIDSHGILFAKPRPRFGVFRPVCGAHGVSAFARDIESSKQVWSSKEGYPGDGDYREFYKDIGYEAEYEYVKPHLHSDGVRRNTGLKYYKITGEVSLGDKKAYDETAALGKAAMHAGNFVYNRVEQIKHLSSVFGIRPVIVSPYDAELFGHWWYEGPDFLNYVFRKFHYDQDTVETISLGDYVSKGFALQKVELNPSSWGDRGYNGMWLNETNDWIYRHLHELEDRMIELARLEPKNERVRMALNQAARELLLAQSSDWPFIMSAGTDVAYAERRFKSHVVNFNHLYGGLMEGHVPDELLDGLLPYNNIFPEMDYRIYR